MTDETRQQIEAEAIAFVGSCELSIIEDHETSVLIGEMIARTFIAGATKYFEEVERLRAENERLRASKGSNKTNI